MATLPTAATYTGDFSTAYETSPTTRVPETPERVMAPALNHPAVSTVPEMSCRSPLTRRRAKELQTWELDANLIGQLPRPDRTLGRTDGSCPS